MSGGKGGKSSTQTSTTTSAPPDYLDSQLRYGTSQIRADYDAGPNPLYPYSTIKGFDPLQMEAAQGTVDLARAGSPLVKSAQTLIQDTLDGKFVGGNPYLDDLLATYGTKAASASNAIFNKSGRLGSGANATNAAKAVSDATLPYLFDQYNTERNNQYQAAQLAPGMANLDFENLNRIAAVGDARQTMDQAKLDEEVARWQYENGGGDDMNLDQYLQRIYGSPGFQYGTETNTTTSKQKGGGLGSVLGTALSLGSMFVPGGQFAGMGLGMGGGLSGILGGLGASNAAFGLSTGGQGLFNGGMTNIVNAGRGFYGPGF